MKLSTACVVCVKNGESTLAECLSALGTQEVDEVVVVVAESTDRTLEIARSFPYRVIESSEAGLAADRQLGVRSTCSDFIAMIDSDHVLRPGQIAQIRDQVIRLGLTVGQAGLVAPQGGTILQRAESEYWRIFHNVPGPRRMIGTAPAVYRREFFNALTFGAEGLSAADDTDLMYRVERDTTFTVGVVDSIVTQIHEGTLAAFAKKFFWYGKGDFDFCRLHPERIPRHMFHLFIRYPLVYPFRALRRASILGAAYCLIQGGCRIAGLISGAIASVRLGRASVL